MENQPDSQLCHETLPGISRLIVSDQQICLQYVRALILADVGLISLFMKLDDWPSFPVKTPLCSFFFSTSDKETLRAHIRKCVNNFHMSLMWKFGMNANKNQTDVMLA